MQIHNDMNKNAAKIKAGIRSLAGKPNEIISGTVIPGSIDADMYTISVQTTDDNAVIDGVMLTSITGSDDGLILFPAENSNVIIGSIDGQGEWFLIAVGAITKAQLKIGSVFYEMDGSSVTIQNGNVVLDLSAGLFKLNTAGESLYQLLKDCFTYITALTVPTPSGTSSVPVNVADFNNLITRLDNLLRS